MNRRKPRGLRRALQAAARATVRLSRVEGGAEGEKNTGADKGEKKLPGRCGEGGRVEESEKEKRREYSMRRGERKKKKKRRK